MWLPIILVLQVHYLAAHTHSKVSVLQPLQDFIGEYYRIVGGSYIDITAAPWQVALDDGGHFCGGTLVAKDIVITAAHCLELIGFKTSFKIRAGSTFSYKDGHLYQVGKVIVHPSYKMGSYDYDIAILWLSKPVRFSQRVRAVDMNKPGEEIPNGALTEVTGWGRIEFGGQYSKVLKKVVVPKIGASQCEKYYPNAITKRMFCAGYTEGGKDSCQGDSGGPLIYKGKLAGVVSWGKGCASSKQPGVYAKISDLRRWIDENIKKIRK